MKHLFLTFALMVGGILSGYAQDDDYLDDVNVTVGGIVYNLQYNSVACIVGADSNLPDTVTIPASITVQNREFPIESGVSGCLSNAPIKYLVYDNETVYKNLFLNNKTLQGVTLSSACKFIQEQAFGGCTALKSIDFGNSLKSIGTKAFRYCTSLTSVTFPATLTLGGLSSGAFSECSALKEVTFKSGADVVKNATTIKMVFAATPFADSVAAKAPRKPNQAGPRDKRMNVNKKSKTVTY